MTLPRPRPSSRARRIAPESVFTLRDEFIELHQLLKLMGAVGSGGEGKALVASGAVSVDGAQELRKTAKIRAGQRVTAGEHRIRVVAPAEASDDARNRSSATAGP